MSEKQIYKWFKWCLVGAVVLWIIIPTIVMWWKGIPDNAGEIGDVFGAVNALFTAIAFGFLVLTSFLQREDLRIQRKELTLTREELKKSAEAQNELVILNKAMLSIEQKRRRNDILPLFESASQSFTFDAYQRPQATLILRVARNQATISSIAISPQKCRFSSNTIDCFVGKTFTPLQPINFVFSTISPTIALELPGIVISLFLTEADGNQYRLDVKYDTTGVANIEHPMKNLT